jgi:fucose permease
VGFRQRHHQPDGRGLQNILLLTNFESSLVQAAFYGGYALMAIPAAIFIKKFSYKKGILIGLALYALGCLLFIPSGWSLTFAPFLLAYLIMTCGLSFLETTANPYILSMGDEETATRRLNLSQAFNPMGSILGMFVASMVILINLDGTSEAGRRLIRGVADGQPLHAQLVGQHLEAAEALAALTNRPGWESHRNTLKKTADQSRALADRLAILADPRPDEARALDAEIKAQPKPNQFAAAMQAVAVVLQLRDRVQPTPAEARRDELFKNPAGLELALLLGKELEALGGQPALAAGREVLGAAAEAAETLAAGFAARYEARGQGLAGAADPAPALLVLKGGLSSAAANLAGLPAAALAGHAAAAGETFTGIQKSDLDIVVTPYALMGAFLIVVLALFAWKLPARHRPRRRQPAPLRRHPPPPAPQRRYLEGVVAQTFYVGAQIMCWTFIIQYAELELGISKSTAQNCNILAMVIFVSSRFICTFILHYVNAGLLLCVLASGGLVFTAGTIFIEGYAGLYCLIGVSACMSLMFPTIYGIALDGLGDDAKLGSAGLILAIGGGCLMPPLQGAIIDLPPVNLGFIELASVRASFFLPLICFAVIAIYGLRTWFSQSHKPGPAAI